MVGIYPFLLSVITFANVWTKAVNGYCYDPIGFGPDLFMWSTPPDDSLLLFFDETLLGN